MAYPAIPLDAIVEPAFLFGADGVVSAANPAAERLAGGSPAGLSADGLAGRLGLRLAAGRTAACFADAVRQVLDGGEPSPLRGELAAGAGSAAVLIATTAVRDDGRIVGALSVWRDAVGAPCTAGGSAYHTLLLDSMTDAVVATDRDLRVTAWNPAAEALYGCTAEEAIGRPVFEVTGVDLAPEERDATLARLDRGEQVCHPIRRLRRDGRPLVGEGGATVVHDASGTPIGYVAVVRDVAPLVRAQASLAESEAKYRNVVELSPDAILIHQDGAIVFANPAAVAMLRAGGPGDLIGRPVLEIVHPGTREHVAWNIETDLRGEESPPATADLCRLDGTTATVQGRGAMIPFGGRPAIQVVLRDVTEEKRAETALRTSEERLRNVLDLSLDAIYRRDLAADRFDYISPVNEQITGYSREEFAAFSQEEFADRFHPDDRVAIEAPVEEGMASRSGTIEYRFRHRDGNYRWLADHFLIEGDEDGRPRTRTGVVRDITREREDREALRVYAEELRRSNEELQRFAYVASHDLQEPLRSIVSFSQLLERRLADQKDEEIGEFLAFIIEGGVRMQTLIQDLLQALPDRDQGPDPRARRMSGRWSPRSSPRSRPQFARPTPRSRSATCPW